MKCPYCQQEAKVITSSFVTDDDVKIWQCLNCPLEVRFWKKMINIFVIHNSKEYCMSWRKLENRLYIFCISTKIITPVCEMRTAPDFLPNVITPNNAYQKLQTFLTFL